MITRLTQIGFTQDAWDIHCAYEHVLSSGNVKAWKYNQWLHTRNYVFSSDTPFIP